MPKKTKDIEKEIKTEKVKPTPKSKKIVSKDDKKVSSSKKSSLTKKNSKNTKTSATTKKTTNNKTTKASLSTKNTTTKTKASSKTTKASASAKKVTKKSVKATNSTEYYDLPYRYNQTIVKILAQTPKKLFIYWDISDDDRNKYISEFGPDFFDNTVPVLVVHNDHTNSSFEVEINDFANSWYLDVNDSKCKYTIELGRKPKNKNYSIPNNYIYVTSSNEIESPNDHILFENQSDTVYFRNVKNNFTYSKNIANLSFMKKIGRIYSIYDAYKKLYSKIYTNEDIVNNFDLSNPSSSNPTSTFK